MAKVKLETWGKHKRVVARDDKGRIVTHKVKEKWESISYLRQTFKKNNSLYEEVVKRKRKNVWEVVDLRENKVSKNRSKVSWYSIEARVKIKGKYQPIFTKSQNIIPPLNKNKVNLARNQALESLYRRADMAVRESGVKSIEEQDPFSENASDPEKGELLLMTTDLFIVNEGLIYYENVKV